MGKYPQPDQRCHKCHKILPETRHFDGVECGCGVIYKNFEGKWSPMIRDMSDIGSTPVIQQSVQNLLGDLNKKPKLDDNERKLVGGYKLVIALLEENKELRDRLQIDPGGSDKIDELEQCIQFLRHEIESLKKGDKTD